MSRVCREEVLNDVIKIIADLARDRDYDGNVSANTRLFYDLRFQSIDAVALGTALEDYYERPLPFRRFLIDLGPLRIREMNVRRLADFIYENISEEQG